jgi:hypothetical protein
MIILLNGYSSSVTVFPFSFPSFFPDLQQTMSRFTGLLVHCRFSVTSPFPRPSALFLFANELCCDGTFQEAARLLKSSVT